MAAEWIKWTKGLTKKPEVQGMAKHLNLSRREVAAALMEVWEWADDNTQDGEVDHVDAEFIDSIVNVEGFGNAMQDVNWLVVHGAGIQLPHFERHNGQSAKRRALDTEQKRLRRATVHR